MTDELDLGAYMAELGEWIRHHPAVYIHHRPHGNWRWHWRGHFRDAPAYRVITRCAARYMRRYQQPMKVHVWNALCRRIYDRGAFRSTALRDASFFGEHALAHLHWPQEQVYAAHMRHPDWADIPLTTREHRNQLRMYEAWLKDPRAQAEAHAAEALAEAKEIQDSVREINRSIRAAEAAIKTKTERQPQ